MSTKTRNFIVVIAVLQMIATVAIFLLPGAVRALPGPTYLRLQHHPLTAGLIELITTPIPAALPVAASDPLIGQQPVTSLNIPGLDEERPLTPTPPSSTTPTPRPTTLTQQSSALPEPEPSPTPTLTPTPRPTLPPPPPSVVLDGLIAVKQGFNNCGPANLTIVLNYHGDDTTQEKAAAYLKPNREDRNVSPWQISDYVNEFTLLRSTVHSGGDLEMIKQFIANGLPVVIEKGYEPENDEGWYGHYLTVYGYDDARQEIYSRDTNLGPFDGRPRIDSYERFLHWWQQFNYTFYVVYEPLQEELVFSIIPDHLQDWQSMWQYTAELARQEIAQRPENVFGWFNLGVSLTRLAERSGDAALYQEATLMFDKARTIGLPPRTLYYEHRPFMAYLRNGRINDIITLTDALLATPGGPWVEEIHWYRGHALAAQGQLSRARDAYLKALEVNPNFYPAQLSLDWVNSELGR